MTLDFKKPEFSQKETVNRAIRNADCRLCDQTFGNLFCWSESFDVGLWTYEDSYAARWGKYHTVPIGPQRKKMMDRLLAEGVDFFISMDEEYCTWLEEQYPGKFVFRERRRSADYIYDREKMATLTGKKLAAKRNHINYFVQNYKWETRPLNRENMDEVLEFSRRWCIENNCAEEPGLERETCAVRRGLRYFEELGYTGLVLYANGEVCAFTFGEPIGKEGFCVHAEKADVNVRGAYPMINREFVRSLPQKVRWINREDDTGDEGLRRAKLSYQPELLLMKYEAEVIEK